MKKHIGTILLILAFLFGVALLLYPTLSDYVNSLHQSKAISTYADTVENMDTEQYQATLAAAEEYNTQLAQKPQSYTLTETETAKYNSLLNVDGSGVMGYIEIPSIKVSLPILSLIHISEPTRP